MNLRAELLQFMASMTRIYLTVCVIYVTINRENYLFQINKGILYMIEILNGIRETVAYDSFRGLKLYHNVQVENYPLHWHTAMEIIMPIENIYTVVIDGTPHTFQEGDIWITPPGTLHELMAPESGERLIMLFDYSLICNVKGIDTLIHSLQPYTLISRREYPELNLRLSDYLNEISREYESKEPFAEACIYSQMINFLVTFGRASFNASEKFPGITSSKQHEYIEKFMDVCNYITDHCTEDISVDDLADLAGFSKFHFARLFKQFSGMSCYEYMTQKRIAYAETLLIQPDLSITEVAMRSGFGSLSTFNRIFKTAKNCTPSEYKNLNRSKRRKAQASTELK